MILFMTKRLFDKSRVEHVRDSVPDIRKTLRPRSPTLIVREDRPMLAERWRRFMCQACHMENSGNCFAERLETVGMAVVIRAVIAA
jgi:hypothetical protein